MLYILKKKKVEGNMTNIRTCFLRLNTLGRVSGKHWTLNIKTRFRWAIDIHLLLISYFLIYLEDSPSNLMTIKYRYFIKIFQAHLQLQLWHRGLLTKWRHISVDNSLRGSHIPEWYAIYVEFLWRRLSESVSVFMTKQVILKESSCHLGIVLKLPSEPWVTLCPLLSR